MKRNNFWLWSNICTSFATVALLSFLTAPFILPVIVPVFKGGNAVLAGNIFMLIGLIVALLGIIANWVAYFINNEMVYLISNIVCNVGSVLSLIFFFVFIPGIVLGWIGYAKIKKESKEAAS